MNKKEMEMPREYYDPRPMLRYNPLWAMILGERSCGKSFAFKELSINTPNSIWIYLRRTDTDRKDPKNWKSYLSDLILAEKIDVDDEYKVSSEGIWVNGEQKVIFSALSTDSSAHSMTYLPDSLKDTRRTVAKANKSKKEKEEEEFDVNDKVIDEIIDAESTFDVPVKKKIVFEEMIEPTGRYLKNEVNQLFEFYNTVDRYTGTQLFGIANLMSQYNPYFEYFGITPFREEFKWYKEKTLLVQNVKLKGMEQFVKNQRFYKLVKGTDYAEYLTNNTPWQDDNAFIEKKPKNAVLLFNIRMYNKLFGVWTSGDKFYVSSKNNPNEFTYAAPKSVQAGDEPIVKGYGCHRVLTQAITYNRIRYDTIPIREMCYNIVSGNFQEG